MLDKICICPYATAADHWGFFWEGEQVKVSADRLAGETLGASAWVLALALAIGCLLSLGSVGTAFAAGTYVLDPNLSLTGSCEITKADPIPDPGCPGGERPPSGEFISPRSIATDPTGNIYIASYGLDKENGKEGRIDVFDATGVFLTELLEPAGPKDIAVDSEGNLYVFNASSGANGLVVRYEPTVYEPEAGNIEYGKPAELVIEFVGGFLNSVAVAPSNDHLFVKRANTIFEFSSAAEENKVLDEEIGKGVLNGANGWGLAVDETHNRIYSGDNQKVRVFELGSPHGLLLTIEESDIPGGDLTTVTSVAADETTGDFFIFDGSSSKAIYQFSEDGSYEATIKKGLSPFFGSEVSVDNSPTSPNQRYLFAPSEEGPVGIAFAFEPPGIVCEPEVEAISFTNVSEADAELQATINPCNAVTTYTFEYVTLQGFNESGFSKASVAGSGEIPEGANGIPVFALATGMSANTVYRFRVVATNEEGTDEAEGEFTTYLPPEPAQSCSNDATRIGPSALLPDCRAYELVTPPDTNARTPHGIGKPTGIFFPTRESSPAGDKVSFVTDGGLLPGAEGTGSLSGDTYLATRGPAGWGSASTGPSGVEAAEPLIGSTSPDQEHSFWRSSMDGTASFEGKAANYIRYPDGHSELIGQGGLGVDPNAEGKLISENGGHILFISKVQLEENAPAGNESKIYDRTPDGVTRVVSLLPNDASPLSGQNAFYEGNSLDGEGIAFKFGASSPTGPLYLRHGGVTYEVAEGATFAGIAEGGERIFYLKDGDIFVFDVGGQTIPLTSSGDATVVNVSANGTAAYFVSPSVLDSGPNPNGAEPEAGKENLYLSREGAISFVGTVTPRDVKGENGATEPVEGLGLWTKVVNEGKLAADPSRTTPDGEVLLFESRANLTGYDPEGHAQIYRYSATGDLDCLSCNPTQAPAIGEASLQSIQQALGGPEPFVSFVLVGNLRADGRRVFFQTEEALVAEDNDGLQDVYEWEDQDVGLCTRPGGCIYLISSGHSSRIDYLYGVSDSGNDVFFRTADQLLSVDAESTPSIYDARVGGGFLAGGVACSIAQDCSGAITPSPPVPAPTSEAAGPVDNFTSTSGKKCRRGMHKVKRNGKVHCVKKKPRHKAGTTKKGGRK